MGIVRSVVKIGRIFALEETPVSERLTVWFVKLSEALNKGERERGEKNIQLPLDRVRRRQRGCRRGSY